MSENSRVVKIQKNSKSLQFSDVFMEIERDWWYEMGWL